jgi:class 3 adenylate cyclase/tetratricopeptide (TPR) repeat protein
MDVVVWLRSLGLERYEAAFRENEINERVLSSLTQEDLKEIGVGPVGHRRMLLEAIAALGADTGSNAPSTGVATTSSAQSVSPEDRAERRQVTVMFSDLVGSTALSARMDPEDLREIISAYQNSVAATVGRFGGFVAKYMGDGVLVYFGYPQAHEDDAERAVRAGLQLVAAIGDLKTHEALQTRVGIATGLVVVGDLIGSGASQEQAIVGDTPNLAARLQGVAEPNSVVIAESTRRLVGSLFELEGLGPQELKGISGPTPAWAALRPALFEGRFEAMHTSGLTDLVGREEELDLLLRRWSKAKSGEGQVVLLSGEAGIGKSRLTAALLERLVTEPHTRLRYFCSPQHTDSAFYPIISQMERAAGLAHDDTAQAKLDKLDTLLAQSLAPREDVALLAEMLSLPNDGRYTTLELAPHQRRQRTLEALTTQIEALARRNPVLMIFEDAHWADPTSLEALGRSVDRISALGVLLIVTYRPEFEPPWVGQPHVTTLTINRLGQREIAAMIDRVTGNKPLLASIRQDIVERTDGIPLFIEEMTKTVLEAGGQEDAERAVTSIPAPSLAVPASLHATLMARLDRLGSAKEVAQIGAVIGREFSHALLAAVARKEEMPLQAALDSLTGAGLLFRQGTPPQATYLFKHGLVQDAAYSTLLRERRRRLHTHIAEVLETQFPEIAESQPELLARHYTEAGAVERAAGFWGKAGQRSLERSALHEAAEQLTRALSQIATLPSSPSSRRQDIMFQVALRHVLAHLKGYTAPETKAAVERTRQLIEQAEARGEAPEDPMLLFSLLNSLWTGSIVTFNGEEACGLAAEFLAQAERQKTAAPIINGYRLVGTSLLMTGDIANGRAHLDRGIALCDSTDHSSSVTASVGDDSKVVMHGFRAIALWLLGNPKAALADAEHALSQAREITQFGTLMHTLIWVIFIQIHLCGDYVAASRLLNELLTLADDKDTSFWRACGMTNKGLILASTGKVLDGIHTTSSGLAALKSTGATMCLPYYSSCLAMNHAKIGQFEDARRLIREAMRTIEETNERWFEAEIYRISGEIELKSPNLGGAKPEVYFARALSVARAQQAKSFELRAAMSMARLWSEQGKRGEARNLLAPIYGWFTEGFDTLDLKAAQVLLDELARYLE